ncbi:hypothetical protein BC940DRAFT_150703 [Gongronella butleri]|nr:hypothetical protein BC940DRAFT_150703 [Gongronella butleri]
MEGGTCPALRVSLKRVLARHLEFFSSRQHAFTTKMGIWLPLHGDSDEIYIKRSVNLDASACPQMATKSKRPVGSQVKCLCHALTYEKPFVMVKC